MSRAKGIVRASDKAELTPAQCERIREHFVKSSHDIHDD